MKRTRLAAFRWSRRAAIARLGRYATAGVAVAGGGASALVRAATTPPPAAPSQSARTAADAGAARAPQPTPFLTSDDGFGPNRSTMVENLHLAWKNPGKDGGDWTDADGRPRGDKPYVSHGYGRGDFAGLDVTVLVRQWVASGANKGFLLRSAPRSNANVRFAGRLANDAATRPALKVETSSGTTSLPCLFFSAYRFSSFKTIDTRTLVDVTPDGVAMLSFDLSTLHGDVVRATLVLTCVDVTFGASGVVDVYALDPPRIYDGNGGEPPQPGIADRFPLDAGLAKHPACLFVGNFAHANDPGWHYGMYGKQANLAYDAGVKSWCYNGVIEPGHNFGLDAQVWCDGVVIDGAAGGRPAKPAWPEMYMRQYIYLNADFFSSHVTDWKIPGLGQSHGIWHPMKDARFSLGGYWDVGSTSARGPVNPTFGGIVKNPAGLWMYEEGSMRAGIKHPLDEDDPEHPYKRYMALYNTPYHKDMTAYDGGYYPWPNVVIHRERWYCIEQYVKMNSIDTDGHKPVDAFGNYDWAAARADGVIKAWVDGRLVADSGPKFRFRRHPAIGLRGLDGNWYFGGRPMSPTRQSFRWRDVVLATQYIGPRREPELRAVIVPSMAAVAASDADVAPASAALSPVRTANTFVSQNPRIPEWGGAFGKIIDDYSGGVFNPYWGAKGCMVFHGGGHAATDDNSVVILDFNDLAFKRLSTPTMDASAWDKSPLLEPYGEYADGQPGACHSYDNLAILPPDAGGAPHGSLIRVQSQAVEYHRSVNTDWAHRFDMAIGQERQHSGRWVRWVGSAMKPFNPGGCSAYDSKRKRFWYLGGLGYSQPTTVRYLDVGTASKAEAAVATPAPVSGADAPVMRYDAERDVLLLSVARNDGHASIWWARPWNREGWVDSRLELPKQPNASTVPFDLVTDTGRYVLLTRADVGAAYEVDIPRDVRERWKITRRPIAGGAIGLAWVVGKRWSYVPGLKAFIWYARSSGPVVAYRPLGA
jgi:hypothetical protein